MIRYVLTAGRTGGGQLITNAPVSFTCQLASTKPSPERRYLIETAHQRALLLGKVNSQDGRGRIEGDGNLSAVPEESHWSTGFTESWGRVRASSLAPLPHLPMWFYTLTRGRWASEFVFPRVPARTWLRLASGAWYATAIFVLFLTVFKTL